MPTATDWDALGERWWAHVRFLADDRLEGRDTGSPGHAVAVQYVADQFRAAGVGPAGTDGYRQPVRLDVTRIDESRCALELVRDGAVVPVRLGDEGMISVSPRSAERFEAAAVFVGYGLTVPELQYDDWAGIDARGKVAVLVIGDPPGLPGPIKSHYQSGAERRRTFHRAGVVGTIGVFHPKSLPLPWARLAASRLLPSMQLVDPGDDEPLPLPFNALLPAEHAERLFVGSGHSFQELLAIPADAGPLPRFPLAVTVRARVATSRSGVTSDNVIGVLPGSDPTLRTEYVAVSAHVDHLGIGEPVRGDRLYRGAMDNASGVASLIEVARRLREAGAHPRRSILFLAVTGEEHGLLGSQYFAAHPTVTGPIVADLNMDMVLPLFPLRYLEVQGLAESTLGDAIRAVAEPAGVQLQADKEPELNRFIRSDQYSFIRRGIPALAFKFGYLPGTPEAKLFKAWYDERYHAPSDDLQQPVDRAAAAQFTALLEQLIRRVADADDRPTWKPDSFFRRFAA